MKNRIYEPIRRKIEEWIRYDIHGCYNEYIELLDKIKFSDEDEFRNQKGGNYDTKSYFERLLP